MTSLRVLRQHRRLLTAPAPVWFLIGVLFAGQLPGEPLHSRLLLVALLFLAFLAGVLHHSLAAQDTES